MILLVILPGPKNFSIKPRFDCIALTVFYFQFKEMNFEHSGYFSATFILANVKNNITNDLKRQRMSDCLKRKIAWSPKGFFNTIFCPTLWKEMFKMAYIRGQCSFCRSPTNLQI